MSNQVQEQELRDDVLLFKFIYLFIYLQTNY